jgi:hypothetical protein
VGQCLGEMLADVNDLKGVDAGAGAGAEELLGASFGATILLGLDRGLDKLRVGAVRMRGIVQMGMGSGGKKLYLVKIVVTLVKRFVPSSAAAIR